MKMRKQRGDEAWPYKNPHRRHPPTVNRPRGGTRSAGKVSFDVEEPRPTGVPTTVHQPRHQRDAIARRPVAVVVFNRRREQGPTPSEGEELKERIKPFVKRGRGTSGPTPSSWSTSRQASTQALPKRPGEAVVRQDPRRQPGWPRTAPRWWLNRGWAWSPPSSTKHDGSASAAGHREQGSGARGRATVMLELLVARSGGGRAQVAVFDVHNEVSGSTLASHHDGETVGILLSLFWCSRVQFLCATFRRSRAPSPGGRRRATAAREDSPTFRQPGRSEGPRLGK